MSLFQSVLKGNWRVESLAFSTSMSHASFLLSLHCVCLRPIHDLTVLSVADPRLVCWGACEGAGTLAYILCLDFVGAQKPFITVVANCVKNHRTEAEIDHATLCFIIATRGYPFMMKLHVLPLFSN